MINTKDTTVERSDDRKRLKTPRSKYGARIQTSPNYAMLPENMNYTAISSGSGTRNRFSMADMVGADRSIHNKNNINSTIATGVNDNNIMAGGGNVDKSTNLGGTLVDSHLRCPVMY